MVKKVAARSSRNVASVRTQSSPSIGATALTAWAPRNPINKYYNGTPREVGAQYILLSPPPPQPLQLSTPRPILSRAAPVIFLLLVASRRKKDLSYVALSQSLHSSYTRSPRPRPRPRNFVSHPVVVRHPPTQPPSYRRRLRQPRVPSPRATLSRSLSAFFSSSRSPPPATTRPLTGPRAHHRLHFTFLVAN